MVLVRALAAFTGGPPAGQTGWVAPEVARVAIRAKLAVTVESLADRLPRQDFR
jgi:hypothetical protein